MSQGEHVGFVTRAGTSKTCTARCHPRCSARCARSTADSFLRDGGTVTSAVRVRSDREANGGFASSASEELMVEGRWEPSMPRTSAPAGPLVLPRYSRPSGSAPDSTASTSSRIVAVAVYCRLDPDAGRSHPGLEAAVQRGQQRLQRARQPTSHVPIRVASSLMPAIRQRDGLHDADHYRCWQDDHPDDQRQDPVASVECEWST